MIIRRIPGCPFCACPTFTKLNNNRVEREVLILLDGFLVTSWNTPWQFLTMLDPSGRTQFRIIMWDFLKFGEFLTILVTSWHFFVNFNGISGAIWEHLYHFLEENCQLLKKKKNRSTLFCFITRIYLSVFLFFNLYKSIYLSIYHLSIYLIYHQSTNQSALSIRPRYLSINLHVKLYMP